MSKILTIAANFSLLCLLGFAGVTATVGVASAATPKSDAGPVFGVGWSADSLANLEIGRFNGRMVSYRFKSQHTGTVSSVRVYFIFRKFCDGCYANGTGGQVLIQFAHDDGSPRHLPGKVLSSALVTDPIKQWNRLVTLDQSVALESGKLYHIVFSNPLTTAAQNYVSIDDLFSRNQGADLQPSATASDLAVLFKLTGTANWDVKEQHVPIFSVNFDDGYKQGQGYIDIKRNIVVLSKSQAARESFVFPGPDQTFRSLAVRLQPAKSRGQALIQLVDEQGQVLASTQEAIRTVPENPTWHKVDFKTPVALKKLGRYSVVVSTQDGAEVVISPLQKGAQYGFDTNTLFTAGHCEVKAGSDWIGCAGRQDLDIPFFMQ